MPIMGRDRKARPLDIYESLQLDSHPKPRKDETFKEYLVRLLGGHDPVLEMLIKMGYAEPSQREYLDRLSEIRNCLHKLDFALSDKWKG